MNLSSEENNLPLLIQTNDPQEFVQVPNICDDLFLTGFEDGTVTWTLGGLPVLLNDTHPFLLNQLKNGESLEEAHNAQDLLPDILNHSCSDNPTDNNYSESNENAEIVYPLEVPDKNFLSDNGLFVTNEVINAQVDLSSECELNNENDVFQHSKSAPEEELLPTKSSDEIQSSDISSQEAFIDIHGMLIPQQSILNLNSQDLLFNIQDTQFNSQLTVGSNVEKNSKFRRKRKIGASISLLKHPQKNDLQRGESTADCEQNSREEVRNSNVCSDDPASSLIKVLNLDGTTAVLNVDGTFFSNKSVLKDNSNIVACDGSTVDEFTAAELPIDVEDDEPDSTVANDIDDSFSIDDFATVVTTYRCKKCVFSCDDREQFLVHFKETHLQPDPSALDSIQQPISFTLPDARKSKPKNKNITTTRKIKKLKFSKRDNAPSINIICANGKVASVIPISSNELPPEVPLIETDVDTSVPVTEDELNNSISETNMLIPKDFKIQVPVEEELEMADKEPSVAASSENSGQQQTIRIIYGDNDFNNITLVPEEEFEKKIMRVKRKKKKVQLKDRELSVLEHSAPISFVSNLLVENNNDAGTSATGDQVKESGSSSNGVVIQPETKNKQLIYLCSQCAEQFLTVEDCKAHMIKDHKLCAVEKNNENAAEETSPEKHDPLHIPGLSSPDLTEKNKKVLEKYFTQDILKSRKHKCSHRGCQYKFARPELLARHESCHVDGVRGQFRCPECGEMQLSWRLCSVHLWRCHQMDVDLYACPLCPYKASTTMKIKYHLKIHGEERDYVCPECGRGFKQPSQLRNHRVIHLDRKVQQEPRWYAQKHCDKCGKMFADSKCLKKHIQAVHSKLKPFICNVCGHTCARKAMLQMHLRQHTGEKPYACKLCFYKTGDHNSLRRHAMRHTGARPYKCPHCDYTAIQSNSYKNHLASKHPGMSGSYSCTECPFKTVNEETFSSHQNDHRVGLIEPNKTATSDFVAKVSNPVNMLYDLNTSSSEMSSNNDGALYAVPSKSRKVILVPEKKKDIDMEDDETQNCFLSLSDLTDEQTVDTGGITIPADPDDPEPVTL